MKTKTLLASCALLLASFAASAANTYTFAGANYDAVVPFPGPCGTGNCANFSTGMNVTGTFSGAGRLPANLPGTDISGSLTSFSFNDGLRTYSSTDPQVRLFVFDVATDANGDIIAVNLIIERWQTPGAAHVAGDRVDLVFVQGAGQTLGNHNYNCLGVGVSPAGTPDSCIAIVADVSASSASSAGAGAFALAAGLPGVLVPTLGEYALLLLAVLMGIFGLYGVRRHNGTAA